MRRLLDLTAGRRRSVTSSHRDTADVYLSRREEELGDERRTC